MGHFNPEDHSYVQPLFGPLQPRPEEHSAPTATKKQGTKRQLQKRKRHSSKNSDCNTNAKCTKRSQNVPQKRDIKGPIKHNHTTRTCAPSCDENGYLEGAVLGQGEYESLFLPSIIENPRPAIHRQAMLPKRCLKDRKEDDTDKAIASMFGFMFTPLQQLGDYLEPQQHNEPTHRPAELQPTVKFSAAATCLITGEACQPHNRDRSEWRKSGRPGRKAWRKSGWFFTEARRKARMEACGSAASANDLILEREVEYQLSPATFMRGVYRTAYINALQAFKNRWLKDVEGQKETRSGETCRQMPDANTKGGKRIWRILMDKEQSQELYSEGQGES